MIFLRDRGIQMATGTDLYLIQRVRPGCRVRLWQNVMITVAVLALRRFSGFRLKSFAVTALQKDITFRAVTCGAFDLLQRFRMRNLGNVIMTGYARIIAVNGRLECVAIHIQRDLFALSSFFGKTGVAVALKA